jgi:SAM-dependent methyltransferase
MQNNCNLCHSHQLKEKLDFGKHPITHFFQDDHPASKAKYSIKLGCCAKCNHVQLMESPAIDNTYKDYYPSSWKAQNHIGDEIDYIQNTLRLPSNAKILEIGSNDGIFLKQLRINGFENSIGIEPASGPRESALRDGIKTLPHFMSPGLAHNIVNVFGQYDLIIIRQVAEHVPDLQNLFESINILLKDQAHFLIEVPDFDSMLGSLDYTAIWEQHVNYFTNESLHLLLGLVGIEVIETKYYNFSGACIAMFGVKNGVIKEINDTQSERMDILNYFQQWDSFKQNFQQLFMEESGPVIIYGVGCRSIPLIRYSSLMNNVHYAVDDNITKIGFTVPDSNLKIHPSSILKEVDPGLVLLGVNEENEEIVFSKNKDIFSRHNAVYSLNPPSTRLPPFWLDMRHTKPN